MRRSMGNEYDESFFFSLLQISRTFDFKSDNLDCQGEPMIRPIPEIIIFPATTALASDLPGNIIEGCQETVN